MESGTTEWTAMMNRLERLEKQNRRFKQIGALALILAGSVLLMGQAPARRTVEANEFVLKDDNGNVRARLDMASDRTTLSLYDSTGKMRGGLGVTEDGTMLAMYDRDGNLRIGLGVIV